MPKSLAVGYATAPTNKPLKGFKDTKYSEEKVAIAEDLKGLNVYDSDDPVVKGKLKAIAAKIINTTVEQLPVNQLIDVVVPSVPGKVGYTIEQHEVEGLRIYEGTYGAAVRMSSPVLKGYTVTSNLKELGVRINLSALQAGQYSTSEVGEYAGMLIGAYRNRLIFSTLEANTVYQTSGAQCQAGASLSGADLVNAAALLEDSGEPRVIVGRRTALMHMSRCPGWSEVAKREFETDGHVGYYGGIPVIRVNSFTDPTYGTVYPMGADDLWMFSTLPCGKFVITSDVAGSNETIMQTGVLHIYYRWDDGFAVWHTNRVARINVITTYTV